MMTTDKEPITTIGAEIRESRLSKKYSQRQMAIKLGVDKTTVSAWERDKRFPNDDHLLLLSNNLGLSINHLLLVSKNRKMVG